MSAVSSAFVSQRHRHSDWQRHLLSNKEPACHINTVLQCRLQWPSSQHIWLRCERTQAESHCGRLCLSWQLLQYTALGMVCTPLLWCLGRLSLPLSVGRKNEYKLTGWVIITMAMVGMVSNCQFSVDSQPKSMAWSVGWRPPGTPSAFITEQPDVTTCRRSTIGGRAFPVAGAKVRNSLPSDVALASSLPVFKNTLKTYLFRSCYETVWLWITFLFPSHYLPSRTVVLAIVFTVLTTLKMSMMMMMIK